NGESLHEKRFEQLSNMLAIDLIQLCICFILVVLGDTQTDVKTVRGIEGQTVTLNTGLTGLQNDVIYWTYDPAGSETIIATLNVRRNIPEYNERLNLDAQSGSLTIKSLTTNDHGLYEIQVISTFGSTLNLKEQSPLWEGQAVTLNTGLTGLQDDVIYWTYGLAGAETTIATLNLGKNAPVYSERHHLDAQSGSLTIKSLTINDNGIFKMRIMRGKMLTQTFNLIVYGKLFLPDPPLNQPIGKDGITCNLLLTVQKLYGAINALVLLSHYCHKHVCFNCKCELPLA
uniref:Immunoglobulin domain-containing protein n=1 Tax=Esox lucius TaxID=8010 RepID=A0A3P8Z8S0_ESOLU